MANCTKSCLAIACEHLQNSMGANAPSCILNLHVARPFANNATTIRTWIGPAIWIPGSLLVIFRPQC